MSPRSAASTKARPLRRDAERNRQRILLAARAAFAERGLAVTLDEIADRAGVGVGTVYRRYPNKDALIEELFEEGLGEIVAAAEAGLAQRDPWQGLVGYLEQALALQASNRALKDLVRGSARGRERVARAREQLSPLTSELLERAKQSGRLRPDLERTDMAMIHVMLGAVIDSTHTIEPDAWRRYLGIVLDGLRTRRSTPTALAPGALDEQQTDAALRTRPGGRQPPS